MDLVSVHPVFNLYNRRVADLHRGAAAAAGQVRLRGSRAAPARRSTPWCRRGVIISGGTVRRSVISPGVLVESHALVEDSVLMDDVRGRPGRGRPPGHHRQERAASRRAPGSVSTWTHDRRRFTVSDGGIVVIGKGQTSVPSELIGGPRRDGGGEGRPAHPGVPARGLRRRRRPRRVPGRGAGPAGRRRGVLLRRAARVAAGGRRPTSRGRRWRGRAGRRRTADHVGRPAHGGRTSRASTWSTATPGTPTSAAIWPSCCTTSPTS